ncbi:MAG: MFS transporter [Eggerthellaceae bacterium]|nr:MFS transporter [Eggerthellaceae bacterium]
MIRFSPDRKGCVPNGYDPKETGHKIVESGVPTKRAVFSFAFVLIAIVLALTQIVSVVNAYFPIYAESVGFSATVGSLMISVALIFDIFLNPIVGWAIDKFGTVKMFCLWSIVGILAMLILLVSGNNEWIAYLGASLEDILYVLLGVSIAGVATTAFGTLNYDKIFSYLTLIGFLVGSVGGFIITSLYEYTGSFIAVFVFCIVCIVLIIIAILWAGQRGKKLPRVEQVVGETSEEEILEELDQHDLEK